MTEQQFRMLDTAALRHNRPIVPVSNKLFFRDCFTVYGNKVMFWYNVSCEDGRENTHSIVEDIDNG